MPSEDATATSETLVQQIQNRRVHLISRAMKCLASMPKTFSGSKTVASYRDHSYGISITSTDDPWWISITPDPVNNTYITRIGGDVSHPDLHEVLRYLMDKLPETVPGIEAELTRDHMVSRPPHKPHKKTIVDEFVGDIPIFGKPETGRKRKK